MSDVVDLKALASPTPAPEPAVQAEQPKPESQGTQVFDPEKFKADVLAEAERRAQSLVDKSASNLSKKAQAQYNATLDALKVAGIEATPEIQAKVRRSVQDGVMFEGQPAPEAGTPQTTQQVQAQPQGQPASSEVQAAIAWAQTVGGINETDPEYALLNPQDLYYSTRKAVDAKKARLAEQAGRPAGTTMVPGGSTQTSVPAKSAQEYKKQIKFRGR